MTPLGAGLVFLIGFFVINTDEETWHPGLVDGLKVMPLHQHNGENIALVKWAPHTVFNPHKHWDGEEIFG